MYWSSISLSDPSDQPSPFSIEVDARDDGLVHLLLSVPGSRSEPRVLWSRGFGLAEDRTAFLSEICSPRYDLDFLGHLTTIFGTPELDRIADAVVATVHEERLDALEAAAAKARDHQIVELYRCESKRGYLLELQRRSRVRGRDAADWTLAYPRAAERDRMCDWLRWQKPRFVEFLDHAARHGDEALARLVTDQMFETEIRVKKEGRGAGGLRPLRMWRGD